jgi:hypothetical protein
VLLGLNLARYRPKIIVIEATLPQSREESHSEWHDILDNANYSFVYFDALNRYYIANESSQLKQHFFLPPNVFDEITPAHVASIEQLRETLKVSEADREARLETINKLKNECEARLETINKLNDALKDSEAEREARLETINNLKNECEARLEAINKLNDALKDMMKKYSRVRRIGPLMLGLSAEKTTLN